MRWDENEFEGVVLKFLHHILLMHSEIDADAGLKLLH